MPSPRPRRGRSSLVLVAILVGTIGGATLGVDGPAPAACGPPRGPDLRSEPLGPADVDGDGCPEVVHWHDGVLSAGTTHFALGRPGDQVVIGDWACDGTPTPALARRTDRVVVTFPRWAGDGDDVRAAVAGALRPGARLVPGPDGCGPPHQHIGGTTSPLLPLAAPVVP